MKCMNGRGLVRLLSGSMALVLASSACFGQTSTWSVAGPGSWSDAARWSAGVPGAGTLAVFDVVTTPSTNVVQVPLSQAGSPPAGIATWHGTIALRFDATTNWTLTQPLVVSSPSTGTEPNPLVYIGAVDGSTVQLNVPGLQVATLSDRPSSLAIDSGADIRVGTPAAPVEVVVGSQGSGYLGVGRYGLAGGFNAAAPALTINGSLRIGGTVPNSFPFGQVEVFTGSMSVTGAINVGAPDSTGTFCGGGGTIGVRQGAVLNAASINLLPACSGSVGVVGDGTINATITGAGPIQPVASSSPLTVNGSISMTSTQLQVAQSQAQPTSVSRLVVNGACDLGTFGISWTEFDFSVSPPAPYLPPPGTSIRLVQATTFSGTYVETTPLPAFPDSRQWQVVVDSTGVTLNVIGGVVPTLSVSPSSVVMNLNQTRAFGAFFGVPGAQVDVTGQCVFGETNGLLSPVSSSGESPFLFLAVATGQTTIDITGGGPAAGRTATVPVRVVDASQIRITPEFPDVSLVGQTILLRAEIFDETEQAWVDVTGQVLWESANTSLATVNQGQVTFVAEGSTDIFVTFDTLSTSVGVEAVVPTSLIVQGPSNVIGRGVTRQLSALAYSASGFAVDVTNFVTWSSTDPASVSVDASGRITGVSTAGATPVGVTIEAGFGALSATFGVTLLDVQFVRLEPSAALLSESGVFSGSRHDAIVRYGNGIEEFVTSEATLATENPSVAAFNPMNPGLLVAAAAGQTTMSVTYGQSTSSGNPVTVVAGLATLSVSPSTVQIGAGYATRLRAIVTFGNGSTRDVTDESFWQSSTPSIVNLARGRVRVDANASSQTATVTALVATESASASVSVVASPPPSTHELISVTTGNPGTRANAASVAPSMSADGNIVAFMSRASNLADFTFAGLWQVYVRDRAAGTTTLISRRGPLEPGNGDSFGPFVSPNGRYVAFLSDATNLVLGDTNGGTDAFVFDRVTQTLSRVSTRANGQEAAAQRLSALAADGQPLRPISISDDGQIVAFRMWSSNIVSNLTPSAPAIFVKNRATQEVIAVPTTLAGVPIQDFVSAEPLLSPDGLSLAFVSGLNTWTGTSGGGQQVFAVSIQRTPTLAALNRTRVSVNSAGVFANGLFSDGTGLTADGRFVAFTSDATNLLPGYTNDDPDLPGVNGVPTIYSFDRLDGTIRAISSLPNGAQPDRRSFYATLTPSGSHAAFYSRASGLQPGILDNGFRQVYVRGLSGGAGIGASQVMSINSLGQMGDDESSLSQYVQLNTDATIVVYASKADNLVPGDGNGYMEVFLTRRTNGPVTPGCSPADVANTDGDPIPDDAIDNGDFSTFFTAFFAAEGDPFRLVADIANTDGETIVEGGGPDGVVDNGDFAAFFVYFFQGCP
ncbi:MAG: GC-type dockerin domain-anchored protein [Phycisphaerales bacterium]|jgi:TolB protein|nr:hypothetical protein [Phycisphaeraceae bacterium]